MTCCLLKEEKMNKGNKKIKFRCEDLQRIFEKFIDRGGCDHMKNLLNQLKHDIEAMNLFLAPVLFDEASSYECLSSLYWNTKFKKIFFKEIDIDGTVLMDKDLFYCSDKTILENQLHLEDFFKVALQSLEYKIREKIQ